MALQGEMKNPTLFITDRVRKEDGHLTQASAGLASAASLRGVAERTSSVATYLPGLILVSNACSSLMIAWIFGIMEPLMGVGCTGATGHSRRPGVRSHRRPQDTRSSL